EELKSGSADFIMSTSKDQRLELDGSEGVELINASYPCTNYVELNTDNSIFSDINVRKAFALAIDRDEFQEISEGGLTPTYSMIIDTMQCFNADVKAWFQENYSYNPDKAIELLEESGWVDTDGDGIREKDGQTLSFTFLAWTDWTVIPEAMANQLAQVGFDMSIEALDWNYIHERCNSDDYDMGISGLGWAEPILIFNICYYDNNAPGNDETYRKMVKEIASEPDTEKRVEKIGEIQMRMFENMNIIPLFMDNDYTAIRTELKGVVAKADGTLSTADMHWEA
ncbi:MAG: ABC transporter substrate-binding protein, partial [Firmicutes bacterium]|nr:ABC transporter substrate-binding protein [Bacillota bacterium]